MFLVMSAHVTLDSILSFLFVCFLGSFDRFQKKPKKYALVLPERNPENKRKQLSEVLKPFELLKCPSSHLGEELQSFMKAIVSALEKYFFCQIRLALPMNLILFSKLK